MTIRKDNWSRVYRIYLMDYEDGLYDLVESMCLYSQDYPTHKEQRIAVRTAAERIIKDKFNRNIMVLEGNDIIYKNGSWVN